jgi:hypothetical protein
MLKKTLKFTTLASLITFSSCADFAESFENVIPDKKIRPYTIIMTPAEASPGDTVHIDLKLHDAKKSYTLDWSIALAYDIEDYGYLNSLSHKMNLDSMGFNKKEDAYGNSLSFDFVIPKGENNPMLLSSLVPDVLWPKSEMTETYEAGLKSYGIPVAPEGLLKKDFTLWADNQESLPIELSPWIHSQVSLVQVSAMISSSDFKLDINKSISIKYTHKMPDAIKYQNNNPTIPKLKLLIVKAKGIEDFRDIDKYSLDTLELTSFRKDGSEAWNQMDTLIINSNYSYFLEAPLGLSDEKYTSPNGKEHNEEINHTWFFSNLDATNSDFDSQFKFGQGELSRKTIPLCWPSNDQIHKIQISLVRTDLRIEWADLHSRGVDFAQVGLYLK